MAGFAHRFKVVMVGDADVGKTSLLRQYVDGRIDGGNHTSIGVDFKTKTVEAGGEQIRLQLWDTAGQERYHKPLSRIYYRGAQGVVVTYDITRQETFEGIQRWLDETDRYLKSDTVTRILIGNKCDLEEQRVVDYEVAKELADKLNMMYMETSAKTAQNVEDAFLNVTTAMKNRIDGNDVLVGDIGNVDNKKSNVRDLNKASEPMETGGKEGHGIANQTSAEVADGVEIESSNHQNSFGNDFVGQYGDGTSSSSAVEPDHDENNINGTDEGIPTIRVTDEDEDAVTEDADAAVTIGTEGTDDNLDGDGADDAVTNTHHEEDDDDDDDDLERGPTDWVEGSGVSNNNATTFFEEDSDNDDNDVAPSDGDTAGAVRYSEEGDTDSTTGDTRTKARNDRESQEAAQKPEIDTRATSSPIVHLGRHQTDSRNHMCSCC